MLSSWRCSLLVLEYHQCVEDLGPRLVGPDDVVDVAHDAKNRLGDEVERREQVQHEGESQDEDANAVVEGKAWK